MPTGSERLQEIASSLTSGKTQDRVTVRTFLSWFSAQRRGFYIVREIRRALKQAGLKTEPDFEFEYIDGFIGFVLQGAEPTPSAAVPSVTPEGVDQGQLQTQGDKDSVATLVADTVEQPCDEVVTISSPVTGDPTYRIGKLAAANRYPVSVKPDSTIAQAVTLMLVNNYSQLPVMQSDVTVKGVVSWSSIGSRLALGLISDSVNNCMDKAVERSSEDSLFAVVNDIVQYQYVLIRGKDNKIKGIVTASDISGQFGQLAEPFLLIGEIEQHIRILIQEKFSIEDLRDAADPEDSAREINSVQDLTFGEYIRLLENPERWTKLNLRVDRGIFIERLQKVRIIRNEVMHFDPDGISEDERNDLRQVAQFMQTLHRIGAMPINIENSRA